MPKHTPDTLGHDRAVNRLTQRIEEGENFLTALPLGYRGPEWIRRRLNRNTRPRRDERTDIYDEVAKRLGATAEFVVVLMWASRSDVDEPPRVPGPLETQLTSRASNLVKIDYEVGKEVYHSHLDFALVTARQGMATGLRLDAVNTSLYQAFSLVHGEEPPAPYAPKRLRFYPHH